MSGKSKGQGGRAPSPDPDVCVVGSGVAGALTAHSLAKRGHEVVILEAGRRFDPSNRTAQMEEAIRPEGSFRDVWEMGGERDRYTSSGDVYYGLNNTRVKAVGGTTLHWLGITPRLHEKDFEMQSRYGLASDWPISYDDLRPFYARAERELGVAGGDDNPFAPPREADYPMPAFPPSYSDTLFAEACDALDITMHSVPQARNSELYDGRSPCVGFSTCIPVCPSGAKYSADVHVVKAEGEGARVIDRAPVQRLEHDSKGERVEAAVYATPDGERHRQTASRFVLACGAVEIPRLLLLSKSDQYPDGLANSSGVVGKYFMDQPIVSIVGELERPTAQEPIGYHTSETHQFYDHEDSRPGSIKFVFDNENPVHLSKTALRGGDNGTRGDLTDVLTGDSWGDETLEKMRDRTPNRRVSMFANPELLPREENAVTLDTSTTDDHGNPVPDVSFNLGPHAIETMERAREIQYRILEEMDATVVAESDLASPKIASHKTGTTRMGTDPSESVVDPTLRTHDLRNLYIASGSAFVTAGAMNPTLTIAALALKAAGHIHEELS
ncbi:GMC family oxidoreductase [Halogeometricum sp. S1BR25-6]|uniref:GMC family oxidoreductase n=1 Tax=Halogeometricum salsisoli TaxID=2950536 RepID=A0ABU2GJD7_9EURY|nr:GMC family oxidoreductase [Halogeometricum sp. S1BR25-6]MDS0300294.1 GMC family oxidoreductase [Halogeometricum sp. S1BR25-6]